MASTKAYTSQIVAITMMSLVLSEDAISKRQRRDEIIDSLCNLPGVCMLGGGQTSAVAGIHLTCLLLARLCLHPPDGLPNCLLPHLQTLCAAP